MPGANEGGSLINGGVISDAIDLGDLDSYTFTANVGEEVQIRIANTSSNDFRPRITLYDPNGAYVTHNVYYGVAAISYTATATGTYTVVVADGTNAKDKTGNYDLYFVHMPGANEGGSLINGGIISDGIDLGDLDSYTFTANAGERVKILIANTNSNDFLPRITLYDPNGAYITYGVGYDFASISYTATATGTYAVVVADGSGTKSQTGNYDLYFRAPGAIDPVTPALLGDINSDGKIDLKEAIYALQVVSGSRHSMHIDSSIVGAWWSGSTSTAVGKIFVLTFFSNGTYIHVQNGDDVNANWNGYEFGNYSYNAETKVLSPTPLVDMNGEVGLSHLGGQMTITAEGNTITINIVNEEEFTFYRVK